MSILYILLVVLVVVAIIYFLQRVRTGRRRI
jgi:hypothetical protein